MFAVAAISVGVCIGGLTRRWRLIFLGLDFPFGIGWDEFFWWLGDGMKVRHI